MLVAVDNVARLNESYGFTSPTRSFGAVARRVRSRMRGKDTLGRFSGNKFGLVLRDCTPDDIGDRRRALLAGVHDDMVRPTRADRRHHHHRGVTAPRHAAASPKCSAAPRDPRYREGPRRGLVPRLPAQYRARGAAPRQRARHDEIVAALNEAHLLVRDHR